MKKLSLRWIGNAGAFLALAHGLPGIKVANFTVAMIASAAYGALVTLVTIALLPFAYTLFLFVPKLVWNLLCMLTVNAGVLYGCAYGMPGFAIDSFSTAAIAAVGLSVVNALLTWILADPED